MSAAVKEKEWEFPAWMVRLNPLLGEAAHNAVYQAFRLRRVGHRRGWWRRWRSNLAVAGASAEKGKFDREGFAVLMLAALVALLTCGLFALPMVLAMIVTSARRRLTGELLPERMAMVFSNNGYHAQAATDLWMAGVRGREVLVANMLELQEGVAYSFWRTLLGAVLLAGGLYVGLWRFAAPGMHSGVLVLALWAMLVQFRLFAVAMGLRSTGTVMEMGVDLWAGRSLAAIVFGQGLRLTVRLMVGFVVFAVCVTVPLVVVLDLADGVRVGEREAMWLMEWGRLYPMEGLVSVVALSLCVPMLALRRLHARMGLRQVERALGRADAAFERFMVVQVMRDPDGDAWARWRYGR